MFGVLRLQEHTEREKKKWQGLKFVKFFLVDLCYICNFGIFLKPFENQEILLYFLEVVIIFS